MAGSAYYVLERTIIRSQGPDSILKRAVGQDWKGKTSQVLCVAAILAGLYLPWIAQAMFVVLALIWLIPDRRVENVIRVRQT
jgi:hypothetical protein